MKAQLCNNMNHSRTNVSIRHCPNCGKSLNSSAPANCNPTKHASLLKGGFQFCTECGKNLRSK